MRHRDPGAGSPFNPGRRRLLQAGLAGIAMTALGAGAAEPGILTPMQSYMGGRILQRVDPQGLPAAGPDTFGPMTFFVFPVAVAAGPFDIYIADAGLGALFRYDPMLDAMMAVPGARVTPQTRISALPDGSVVMVEGRLGVPRRYSRIGRQMQTINPQNTGSQFDDVVVDAATGRYIGLDRVQRRIEEIQPLGRSSAILADDLLPKLPSALAVDKQMLYAAGQDCQCVVAVDLMKREKHILAEDITQASALAAGDGWLVIADNVERVLRIYRDNMLRADPSYESLRLVNPQGFSIARGTLYVADPGGRRVATFRMRQ